jgi:hypothetical protein
MKRTIFALAATLLTVGLVGCAGNNINVDTQNEGNVRILDQGNQGNTRGYNQKGEVLQRDRKLLNEENNYYHDRLNRGNRPEHNEPTENRPRRKRLFDF